MIEHSALTAKVYDWLRDAILHHRFRPGDKLDVQQLADQLGVSRTPVKDAVNRLTVEGLVVLRSRQGTYVATLSAPTLRELFAVREMIEREVAGQLSPAALRERVSAFADLVVRCGQLLAVPAADAFDYSAFVALDRQLHGEIVALAGNGALREIYQGVTARMWIGRLYYAGQEESFRRSLVSHDEHAAIVSACGEGDPRALAAALLAHSRSSQGHTLGVLARSPAAPHAAGRQGRAAALAAATSA